MGGTTGVFVDDAGRRSRWIARAGRLAGAACIIYIVVIVASLFGATWVPRVALPGVGRVVPSGRPVGALVLPPTAAHTPFPTPAVPTMPVVTTAPAVPPGGGSAAVPSPAPGVTTTIPPATTQPPGHSGSAPGHASTTIAASGSSGTTSPPTTVAAHGHSTTAPGRIKKGG